MDSAGSRSDWVFGTAAAATGVGILTFALFPLAIPIVVLTIVATLPFALPLIAVAAIAAILIGAWLGIRAAGRGIRRLGRGPGRRASPGRTPNRRPATRHDALGDAAATGPRP
ncbi:MAG: hypothetical protein ACRDLO_02545 [Solirubrobacterales bacterium]